jgi:hypothetical protein
VDLFRLVFCRFLWFLSGCGLVSTHCPNRGVLWREHRERNRCKALSSVMCKTLRSAGYTTHTEGMSMKMTIQLTGVKNFILSTNELQSKENTVKVQQLK